MPNKKNYEKEALFYYHFEYSANHDRYFDIHSGREFTSILRQWGIAMADIPDYFYLVYEHFTVKCRIYSGHIVLYIKIKKPNYEQVH